MHGQFAWNELMTDDVEKAKAFYAAATGWTYDEFPVPDGGVYWVAMLDGKPAAGIMPLEGTAPPGTPPYWFSYIEVDDVDARVAAMREQGARIEKEPWHIPMVGRIAIVQDPTGAMIGWMTPEAQG